MLQLFLSTFSLDPFFRGLFLLSELSHGSVMCMYDLLAFVRLLKRIAVGVIQKRPVNSL